jgi:hypothetical protein
MALGTLILAVAFVDEFILECLGKRESAQPDAALHNE